MKSQTSNIVDLSHYNWFWSISLSTVLGSNLVRRSATTLKNQNFLGLYALHVAINTYKFHPPAFPWKTHWTSRTHCKLPFSWKTFLTSGKSKVPFVQLTGVWAPWRQATQFPKTWYVIKYFTFAELTSVTKEALFNKCCWGNLIIT